MYCFTQKCKMLTKKAKEWSQTIFGNVAGQIRRTDAQLSIIQPLIINNSATPATINKYNVLLINKKM